MKLILCFSVLHNSNSYFLDNKFGISVTQYVHYIVSLSIADIMEALLHGKCASAWNSVSSCILQSDLPDFVAVSKCSKFLGAAGFV
jgi:hypothetical protein